MLASDIIHNFFKHYEISFLKQTLFIFRQRRNGGERGREKSMCGCTLVPPTGDLACNPGMWPDWEPNQRPFGLQADILSTKPHQPGLSIIFNAY